MDIGCTLGITVVALGLSAMFYGYKIKTDKKGIKLEKNDQEHEHKIKVLEDKNGHEQHQIDELKQGNSELKDLVIKLQERIINCEKNNGIHNAPKNIPNKGSVPTPPPPPTANKSEQKQTKPKEQQKSHQELLKEALEKCRKSLEGEEE